MGRHSVATPSKVYSPSKPYPDRVIASYPAYRQAELAVTYLAHHGLPAERVAIAGRGMRSVRRPPEPLTIWDALGQAGLTGAVIGGLLGWLLRLLDLASLLVSDLVVAMYGVLFGTAIGGLVGLATYVLTNGWRGHSARSSVVADAYDVLADRDLAVHAVRLVGRPRGRARVGVGGSLA